MKCGFKVDNICYCDDEELCEELCRYSDISGCPVHMDPDYLNSRIEVQLMTEKHLREELKIRLEQLELYKRENQKLKELLELQTEFIDKVESVMGECDPFLCDSVKEELMYED